jgi:hypothetical protein
MISRNEEKLEEDNLTAEEKFHSNAIDKEKIAYNDTIEYLRKLKGTIENQQKVVEKARTKMQSDFDVWYREMCSREVIPGLSSINEKQQHPSDSPTTVPAFDPAIAPPPVIPPSLSVKEPEPDFQLPPGIQLTGNKEADDDIIAFFKAKQVLLSRTRK